MHFAVCLGSGDVLMHGGQDGCRLVPCLSLSSMKMMIDHMRYHHHHHFHRSTLSTGESPTTKAPTPPPPPPPPPPPLLPSHSSPFLPHRLPISPQILSVLAVHSSPALLMSLAHVNSSLASSSSSSGDRDFTKDNSIADLRLKAKRYAESLGPRT